MSALAGEPTDRPALLRRLGELGIRAEAPFRSGFIAELAARAKVFREEFGLGLGLWKGYGYEPRKIDFEAFDRALTRLLARHPQARFSIDLRGAKALRDYYGGRKGAAGAAYCDGPWTQVNVLPNGLVWACPDFILGDLMEQDLESLWDGPRARALRRRVCRNLFPACRGCFSFYGKEQPLGADAQPPARRSR